MSEFQYANKTKPIDFTQVLHYHLYSKPLYTCCASGETELNVIIIGFDNSGSKFLDLCLPLGQMRGKTLHVTVVTDDLDTKSQYLSDRPELAEYFAVDRPIAAGDYGSLCFRTIVPSGQPLCEAVQDFVIDYCNAKRHPHYIFVSLGEDYLNLNMAQLVHEVADAWHIHTAIHFICEHEPISEELGEMMYPVYLNTDIQKSDVYSEIERMAFNTHLIWEKAQNTDYRTLRARFRKPYYHNSCVSNVVSIKYKLYSIGINLDEMDYDAAAQLFHSIVKPKQTDSFWNELIWIEHRRWIVEKLCNGWRCLRNLEECPPGQTKDERHKRHICMVRSDPNQNLVSKFKANSFQKWDTATESELKNLDELDRVSVKLHRLYVKKADEARKKNLLSGGSIVTIRSLIRDNTQAMVAFQEWFTCLKEIWNCDYGKVPLYNCLKTTFINSVAELPPEIRRSVTRQVKAFEALFYPILASAEHRDFKQDDASLINNIPFILTYCPSFFMAVPYNVGNNTAVFSNIAAASVANPSRILFLAYLEDRFTMEQIQASLPGIVQFINKRKMRADLEFVFLYNSKTAANVSERSLERLTNISGNRIRKISTLYAEDDHAAAARMKEYLLARSVHKVPILVEKNNAPLSYMLRGSDFYESFPWYQFDMTSMEFTPQNGCEFLAYIRRKIGITVTDLTALQHSYSKSSSHPEFFNDYACLWERYEQNSLVWKDLCESLAKHSSDNDKIAVFCKKLDRDKQANTAEYRYLLPFECYGAVDKILRFLTGHGIAEQGSIVNSYTTNSCEVIILDKCRHKQSYDKLFAQPYALLSSEALDIHLNTGSHEVSVSFDNLVVDNLLLEKGRKNEMKELMRFFESKGFVNNLRIQGDTLNFTYATRQIKSLLTTAGMILEIYTYHKAKEHGRFDDVVSGYEISWEGTDVLSEFDCIITKGFQSLFVECKARAQLDQNFYFKLFGLAEKFGVNAKAVLIADTQERAKDDRAMVNEIQRERGKMLEVITVWKHDEIRNIGKILLDIMNGCYEEKI